MAKRRGDPGDEYKFDFRFSEMNGRMGRVEVLVLDAAGVVKDTDRGDLCAKAERHKVAAGLAKKLGAKAGPFEKKFDDAWAKAAAEALRRQKAREAGDPDAADGPDEGAGKSAAGRLVGLVLAAGVELFHAPDQSGYAAVPAGGHREVWPLRSQGFRRWLARLFYQDQGKPPGGQAVQDAMAALEGRAAFDGPERPVHVRLGEHAGKVYLDLADTDWRAVEVGPDGWRVVGRPPICFRRPKGLVPLPIPEPGGSVEDLRDFVNVGGEEDWRLLVAWLVQALRPRGPYPVLCFTGEHGSAKSTAARVVRSLIDPSVSLLRGEPRELRDLMIAATNAWVVAYDNLSGLPPWLSDALCRLATGGGFSTRELYSDGEEIIFEATRPCVLNSIEDLATRADLLDRCLLLSLPGIEDERRLSERAFWGAFELARPRILGALLSAASAALRDVGRVDLKGRPRMADFAEWVVAAESELGWPAGSFLTAYGGNRADANELALEASALVPPLRQLLEKGKWSGTATELLKDLTALVPETVAKSAEWPKKGHVLSGRLRRIAPNLRKAGVGVVFDKDPSKKRSRLITLSRPEKERPGASEASAPEQHDTKTQDGKGVEGGRSGATSDAADASDAPRRDFSDGGARAEVF